MVHNLRPKINGLHLSTVNTFVLFSFPCNSRTSEPDQWNQMEASTFVFIHFSFLCRINLLSPDVVFFSWCAALS